MAELRALENLDKVTASMLKETMAIGKDRVAEIDKLSAKIQDPSVKAKVLEIREQVVKIFENFKNIQTVSFLLPRHYNQDYPQVYRSIFAESNFTGAKRIFKTGR